MNESLAVDTRDRTLLQAVARGQEFVLDCDEYPEAMGWVGSLIRGLTSYPGKRPFPHENHLSP